MYFITLALNGARSQLHITGERVPNPLWKGNSGISGPARNLVTMQLNDSS
jgi:hypothetical protein